MNKKLVNDLITIILKIIAFFLLLYYVKIGYFPEWAPLLVLITLILSTEMR